MTDRPPGSVLWMGGWFYPTREVLEDIDLLHRILRSVRQNALDDGISQARERYQLAPDVPVMATIVREVFEDIPDDERVPGDDSEKRFRFSVRLMWPNAGG